MSKDQINITNKSQRKVDTQSKTSKCTQSKTSKCTQSKTSSHSQRRVDSKASDIITDWLQQYYLTKVFDKSVVNVDKQSQICGVDILAFKYYIETNVSEEILATMTEEQYLIDINSCDAHVTSSSNITQQEVEKKFLIDVKAQLNYINNPTDTFAIELEFKNRRGVIVDGWGTQPSSNNTYYLFAWIHECSVDNKKELNSISQVDRVEVCLVSRGRVGEWIDSLNLDIKETCDMMRRTHTHRVDIRGGKYNSRLAWFVFSDRLAEEPIVLVVPKSKYIELCDWYGFVTKDKIERLRGIL